MTYDRRLTKEAEEDNHFHLYAFKKLTVGYGIPLTWPFDDVVKIKLGVLVE
jgi:hypothetical protein